jgi:hypothetical protein
VLDNKVTEIEMKERQFGNSVHLQSVAEKLWSTIMSRAQKRFGIFAKRLLGTI